MTAVAASPRRLFDGAFIVAGRELRDQLRDWRILTPIIALTLFFPALMNFTAQQAVSFVSQYDAPIIGERLIPFLLMVVGFFPISFSLVIALESFAGERERLSLEPLLATPLTDAQLYLGKMIASLVPPLLASYLGISVYLTGLMLQIGWRPPAQLLVQVILLTTAQALVMVSGAVVISSQTTSVRAANLLASFIIVPVSQLVIGESLIMFWGRYQILWWIVAALILIAAILGRMGLNLFNREELLGREIDVLDLRWAWRRFSASFVAGARSPWEWYRGLLSTSLPRLRVPLLIMVAALLAGYGLGFREASQFTLPAEVLQLSRLPEGLGQELTRFGLLSTSGWLWVLTNNIKALAIAALLGMFSAGVMAVLLLMAPTAIIGYFAGNLALAGQDVPRFLLALVAPHGVLEIPATLLAGAAIIRLGLATVSLPKGTSLGQSWLTALAEWARLSLGLVLPLLVAAAALEVFLTPRVALLLLTGP
jgi:ABC-type transport system involved in multi-copper enzyme maturation permease subunit